MLTLPPSVHIYLAAEPVDLRRGHDGLYAIVRNQWRLDPFAGHLFVFVGCRGNRIKILFWVAAASSSTTSAWSEAASVSLASARERAGSPSMRRSWACCSTASTSSTFAAPSTGALRPPIRRARRMDDMDLRFGAAHARMDGQPARDVIKTRSCRPSTSAAGVQRPTS